MSDAEIPLVGGRVTAGVVRIGDTVRRPVTSDRSQVHALLLHLERAGFDATPRYLGIDAANREILSFLPGEVPADLGHYEPETLAAAANLLRRFHDATADFAAKLGAEIICHNDWGPPNAVFRDGRPVGLIDFDTLRPGLRLWDLGYSAAGWLDLGSSDYSGDDQLTRLAAFAAGYAHPACPAAAIAACAVARLTALSVAGEARRMPDLATWAAASARWTVENLTERLLPTGMMPNASS